MLQLFVIIDIIINEIIIVAIIAIIEIIAIITIVAIITIMFTIFMLLLQLVSLSPLNIYKSIGNIFCPSLIEIESLLLFAQTENVTFLI